MTWLKCSKDSRIGLEFFCRFAFLINFTSFKPDTENDANFDGVSSKRANFDEVQFF